MLMDFGDYEAAQDSDSMDEFAVPRGSEKELRDQHTHVERIFGVTMNILGVLTEDQLSLQTPGQQQMWIQLQGDKSNIVKAKDYIKGICTPELIEDFSYPREMYCIFVGAHGLFLDCLIRATSACVKPQTPGRIRISGLVEEVVMAQSRIYTFLDESVSKADDQEASIKRNFKELVENYTDQHSLDLLILPTSIKEQLLFLVEEDKALMVKRPVTHDRVPIQPSDTLITKQPFLTAPVDLQNPISKKNTTSQPMNRSKPKSAKRVLCQRASEPRELITDSGWENSRKSVQIPNTIATAEENKHYACSQLEEKPSVSKTVEPLDEEEDDEFKQISGLLDTIMGRDEREPGSHAQFSLGTQKEFNMLLDFFKTMGYQESVVLKVLHENGIQEPSEILDKVNMEQSSHEQLSHKDRPSVLKGKAHTLSSSDEDDYMLEVMKSAAKNCGYSPSEIVDIGDGSVTGLLRKLNEKNNSGDFLASPALEKGQQQQQDLRLKQNSTAQSHPELNMADPRAVHINAVKPKTLNTNFPEEDIFNGGAQQEPVMVMEEMIRRDHKGAHNVPVVTGAQRFNEAMQTPFKLNLRNEKGNDQLRHIIIDGSNVAMIHGLHRFFSCRGIALAVQYFWDRGHRNITAFVPQWRIKKDSNTKEQHFLTELKDLGLLSCTPSRTVEGKRITSYDDRFMLQLAEKTDGVIVTNDNLRDIFAESHAWQNIIKDRLLQFTFVGNIFMVPDDPLGRHGPPLNKFLTKNSLPKAKSKGHSFAGRRTTHPPPKPTFQTEVLNLRDRKPMGYKEREDTVVRSPTDTEKLKCDLLSIFPLQYHKVDFILQREPCLTDLNKLSELIINLKF